MSVTDLKPTPSKTVPPPAVTPDQHAVAAVFTNPANPEQIFLVKRPDDPTDIFCNCWGFPAATLEAGETVALAIARIGSDKLGLTLAPEEKIISGQADRVTHKLDMELWRVKAQGQLKLKRIGRPDITYYVGWKWGTVADLEQGAVLGSLCCSLYRQWAGVEDEEIPHHVLSH